MMYNRQVLFDYIYGNDIKDYNIEDLENDCHFMMNVIKITKDKKMYNLCSDNVMQDYEFVKFLITTFEDDASFCCMVANKYLDYKKLNDKSLNFNDKEVIEICIIMRQIVSKQSDISTATYGLVAECFNTFINFKIDMTIKEEENPRVRDELGLGFVFIVDNYSSSYEIMKFFAIDMLNKIFYENPDMTLEEIIHSKFRDKEKLQSINLNTFIIDYVNQFDQFLACYIACHLDTISNIKADINNKIKHWDSYIKKINTLRRDILEQYIIDFWNTYQDKVLFDCYSVSREVIKSMGVDNIFNDNDDDFPNGHKTYKQDNNILEMKFRLEIENLIKKLLAKDVITRITDDYNYQRVKTKTLSLDFKNKREL